MKRKIKTNIKNLLKTMQRAHTHAYSLLQDRHAERANELLSQCQDCAMHIGESIEKSEGMDTQAVAYLELYCEQLYEMSRTIERKTLKILKRQLDDTLQRVEDQVELIFSSEKLKIIFMPYKAAMWDCMESVWEAASNDEDCEVKVIPIPYYERDTQGKLEKLCYEGGLFPDYVPILHYSEFSFETDYADIIYIHNPYDNGNYVTSVHPDYYSSNLKKYTDSLVYIPYYICGEGEMPDSHKSLPAYSFVDKIIVQDSKKAESLSDFVPSEKIVAIGSPKADRLRKLEKRKKEIINHEIPKDWKEKIEGKKVFLFNVSITGILQNSKYALDKIRYVLSEFEGREDVILLWRPHPLIEATLMSMRPEMYKEYMEIKNSFIHRGKGILDETSEAGIAAVIADAYVGESTSSIVHYFGVLGKPILYIDWSSSRIKNFKRGYMWFYTFFKEGDNIFFVPSNQGLAQDLYRCNLKSGKVEKELPLPGSAANTIDYYVKIKKVKTKIILIPHNSEDIYIYDLNKKNAVKLVLSEARSVKAPFFGEAIEYKDKLYLIPKCYPALVSIDIQNYEVCEYKEPVGQFRAEDPAVPNFFLAYFAKKEYLYLAGCNESKIIIFNMNDGSFSVKEIGTNTFGYCYMVYDGEYFWLAANKANYIVRWDEKTGDTKLYKYPIEENQSMDNIWVMLLNSKDEIIVCSGFSSAIIFIDKKTGTCRRSHKIEKLLSKEKKQRVGNMDGFGFAAPLDSETAILFNRENCSINIWNMLSDQWTSYPCRLPIQQMLEAEKKQIEKQWICFTTPYSLSEEHVTIPQFVDYIAGGDTKIFKHTYDCYQEKENLTIGQRIHQYMKKEIIADEENMEEQQ